MEIKQLLDSRGIAFKEKGKDLLVLCLSPDHDDSAPSCYIDKETGVYHCYSCGFKGRSIHEFLGVDIPRVSPLIQSFKRKLQELSIFSVGIQVPESSEPFSREFRDISPDTYKKLNAFTHSDWEGRVCFPIEDLVTGNISAILQRTLYTEIKPKYMVHPEGVKLPFYPAKPDNGATLLVEGIFDVANLLDKGLDNATQIFGVSTVTQNTVDMKQLPLIAQGTKKVVILLDNDEAGNKASITLSKLLSKFFKVHIANSFLPEGTDPGQLSEKEVTYLRRYIDEINWLS